MDKKVSIILIIIVIIIAVLFSVCFLVFRNNLSQEIEDNMYSQIEKILLEKEKPRTSEENNDFKAFLSMKKFGHKIDGNKTYIYCWVQIESFYKKADGKITTAQGSSIPYRFTFENDEFVEYKIPQDGVMYSTSSQDIFPFYVRMRFNNIYNDNYLKDNILTQVEEYYNITREDIVY